MVERLYGIEHGMSLTAAGIRIPGTETPVAPSAELMTDLLNLPKGSSVGIEYVPQFQEDFTVDEVPIKADAASNFYWRRIIRTCQLKGLDIVYLDDFETYKKHLLKTIEASAYQYAIYKLYTQESQPLDTQKLNELENKHYAASVESEYIFVVEREAKILEKIRQTNPTVVILGKGHTEYLINGKNKQASLEGVNYKTEMTFPTPWHWSEDLQPKFERATIDIRGRADKRFAVNKEILLDRELLQRRYRSLIKGRVTEGKKPDFVGTWDMDIPARGLFEVFIKESRIEDNLGSAVFTGIIEGDEVNLLKGYDPEKSATEAVMEPVRYTGRLVNEQYEGIYQVKGSEQTGKFTLRKFKK